MRSIMMLGFSIFIFVMVLSAVYYKHRFASNNSFYFKPKNKTQKKIAKLKNDFGNSRIVSCVRCKQWTFNDDFCDKCEREIAEANPDFESFESLLNHKDNR